MRDILAFDYTLQFTNDLRVSSFVFCIPRCIVPKTLRVMGATKAGAKIGPRTGFVHAVVYSDRGSMEPPGILALSHGVMQPFRT